jgi:hypothetical protein
LVNDPTLLGSFPAFRAPRTIEIRPSRLAAIDGEWYRGKPTRHG